jgi:hypothetical protein
MTKDKFFEELVNGASWSAGVSFKRSNPLPLDKYSVFGSTAEANAYLSNAVCYPGQVLAVIENIVEGEGEAAKIVGVQTTVYVVDVDKDGNFSLKEVGTKPVGDEASIEIKEDGTVAIYGFDDAESLTLPQKQEDGSIKWVPISAIVEGDGNTKTYLSAADKSVTVSKTEDSEEKISYTVAANISTAEGNKLVLDESGLYVSAPDPFDDTQLKELIKDNADAIKDNADAIDALEGRVDTLEEGIKGLTGAMHFKGAVDALPENTEGYVDGDVIVVDTKEYVCSGQSWVLFGDVTVEGQRLEALEKFNSETLPNTYASKNDIKDFITKDVNNLTNYDTALVADGKVNAAIEALKIADYAKTDDVKELLKEKQDTIADLEAIREGAGKGATALQSDAIVDMLTKTAAQGIYETIIEADKVRGRVKALEESHQDPIIAGDGLLLADDNKTLSIATGDGLKVEQGLLIIDDEHLATQAELNSATDRIGVLEGSVGDLTLEQSNRLAIYNVNASEFTVDENKVLSIVKVSADKVDGLIDVINNTVVLATDAKAGLVKGSSAENKIKVESDGTMSINSVNVDKLVQAKGHEIVLFGGKAYGLWEPETEE